MDKVYYRELPGEPDNLRIVIVNTDTQVIIDNRGAFMFKENDIDGGGAHAKDALNSAVAKGYVVYIGEF